MADLADSGGVRPGTKKFTYNDKPGKPTKPGKPGAFTATPDEVAADFGFKLAFINSDPELKAAFAEFVQYYVRMKGKVAPERFKLMLDQWADKKGYTATDIADRRLELEQPEDYAQAIASDVANLRAAASEMGAQLDDATLEAFVKRARRMGMNPEQQRQGLVQYVTAAGMDFEGQAGLDQDELAKWAEANGVTITDSKMAEYVRQLASGQTNLDEIKSDLRRTFMAGAYPAWADKINAGWDIADIAAPYKQAMAQLLEVDENSITFSDPLLSAGLQATGQDGKPSVMPLYEYQNLVRKDPRWQKTDNAYATYSNVASNLLRTFGFA